MPSRRSAAQDRVRCLGIGLLILGLGHTPWPEADFHNVRHHDAPGEVCRYHDHLLRWHPGAGSADDVAMLHWHWVLPGPGTTDTNPEDGRPALIAALPDWSGLTSERAPQIAVGVQGRPIDPPGLGLLSMLPPTPDATAEGSLVRAGPTRVRAFGATFARRISRNALLNRWTC